MTNVTGDRYDPSDDGVLGDVASVMVDQLSETVRLLGHWRTNLDPDLRDVIPPHIDEADVNYQTVDTWHGGNPRPALDLIVRTLTEAGVIDRLRSSAIGALERHQARWAKQHNQPFPKPMTTRRQWEVTDADGFEHTISRFLRYPNPLPAEVRALIAEWAARPETNAGAPERGPLLDDFLSLHQHLLDGDDLVTDHRDDLRGWYIETYHDMHTDFADDLWRWLNTERGLRKPTPTERLQLGVTRPGTRVYDRARMRVLFPELDG